MRRFLIRQANNAATASPGTILATIAIVLALSGCANRPPPVSSEVEQSFKEMKAPPSGLGRVYILPELKGSILLGEFENFSVVYFGNNETDIHIVGTLYNNKFVGFDAAPGTYFIKSINTGSTTSSSHVVISANTTIAFRPVANDKAGLLPFGLIGGLVAGALESDGHQQFQMVAPAEVPRQIQSKTLTPISQEARAFVQQAATH